VCRDTCCAVSCRGPTAGHKCAEPMRRSGAPRGSSRVRSSPGAACYRALGVRCSGECELGVGAVYGRVSRVDIYLVEIGLRVLVVRS
jgi:hypothetical protein